MGHALGLSALSLGVLLFPAFASSQCQPQPVVANIQNVSLPNGASARGVSMIVGSNNQNISFFASGDYNETYIYGTDGLCSDEFSSEKCVTYRGGAYDAPQSSTERSLGRQKSSDGFDTEWTEDSLKFGSNTSLPSFGFGVPRQDLNQEFTSQSQLGLGANSSFLQALVTAGIIGTKAYSIFWGLVGGPAARQTQGSLVFGGLDRSLIADQNENFTASLFWGGKCGTGMVVTISDIVLNWPNGTDMSIFLGSQSAAIQACISPSFAGLMSLPLNYYQSFASLAGGTPLGGDSNARSLGINYLTMLFEPDDAYYGDMTIKLQNSVSVKIPNTELVVPNPYIASDGEFQTNTSVRNIVINSLQADNDNDLPVLGRLFMSSAYVMVNQEAGKFFVWQANTGSRTPNIVAVDQQNNMVSEFCANTTKGSSTGGSSSDGSSRATSSPTSSSLPSEGSKLSGGTIAGIVVGVVGGLAMLGAIAFLLYRRRRRGSSDAPQSMGLETDVPVTDFKPASYNLVPAEPHELPGEEYTISELGGTARPHRISELDSTAEDSRSH